MGIEFKIVGQIPLDQLERGRKKKNPELYSSQVRNYLKSLAENVNERYGNILESDGRIKITDEDDAKFIKIKEEAWARESGLSLEDYRRKKESSSNSLAEQAITLSLAKVLGSRFLSVRSSAWDDYENGVDNLLLDVETGSVVCGFDEIVEGYGQDGGAKKEKKIMDKFAAGGSFVKYGIKSTGEEGKEVSISKQTNLPTFFVSLTKDELSDLLENINRPEISSAEKKVIGEIISSLEYQVKLMNSKSESIKNNRLAENLGRANDLIMVLKEKVGV